MSAEAKALLEAIGELTAKIESLCETVEPIAARFRAEDERREKEALAEKKVARCTGTGKQRDCRYVRQNCV